jgi:hypothetical protein
MEPAPQHVICTGSQHILHTPVVPRGIDLKSSQQRFFRRLRMIFGNCALRCVCPPACVHAGMLTYPRTCRITHMHTHTHTDMNSHTHMYAYTHIRICTHTTLALLPHSRLAWLIMYFCEIECFRVEFYKCLPCTYIRVYACTQTAHGLPRDLNAPWRDKHRKGQVSAQSTPQGKLGDLSHSSQYVELASEVHF